MICSPCRQCQYDGKNGRYDFMYIIFQSANDVDGSKCIQATVAMGFQKLENQHRIVGYKRPPHENLKNSIEKTYGHI